MLLPRHVLDKMDYYTCQTYSQGSPNHSTITIFLKKKWWQWWISPIVININCIISVSTEAESKRLKTTPDPEYLELKNQVNDHTKKLPKGNASLSVISGGKIG